MTRITRLLFAGVSRDGIGIGVVLVATTVSCAVALAETHVTVDGGDDRTGASYTTLRGSQGVDDIRVSEFTGGILVRDPAGVSSGGCRRLNPRLMSCRTEADVLDVYMRSGEDKLLIGADVSLSGRLIGGRGEDAIIAGDRHDFASGGAGADSMRGMYGADEIYGEAGSDTLRGGPGDDYIGAAWPGTRDRDRLIDCGPGNDAVSIDGGVDPRPIRCERIERI